MLSTLPAVWSELGSGKPAWELTAGGAASDDHSAAAFDESALLASRLCQHQIDGGGDKPIMLQLSDLHCHHGLAAAGDDGGAGGFLPLPLFTDRSGDDMDAAFKSPNGAGGDQALYNGFGAAGMHGAAAMQPLSFGQVYQEPLLTCCSTFARNKFFAERHINPGEEITYDYHFNREDEGQRIPCFCRSRGCRRYLN